MRFRQKLGVFFLKPHAKRLNFKEGELYELALCLKLRKKRCVVCVCVDKSNVTNWYQIFKISQKDQRSKDMKHIHTVHS